MRLILPIAIIALGVVLFASQVALLLVLSVQSWRQQPSSAERRKSWGLVHLGVILIDAGLVDIYSRGPWDRSPLVWFGICYVGFYIIWSILPAVRGARRATPSTPAQPDLADDVRTVSPASTAPSPDGPALASRALQAERRARNRRANR
jgi:hypothetical protein